MLNKTPCITKYERTGKMCSLQRGFVISGFFSIHFTITGLKNVVRYTGIFVIQGFAISGFFSTVVIKCLCPTDSVSFSPSVAP